MERILFPDNVTGLPKQSDDSTVIRIGQLEIVSVDPFVIDPLANTVANLSAEKLDGRDLSEVKQETLEAKKVVEYRQGSVLVSSGQTQTEVTADFISGHTEFLSTYVATPTIEGVVLWAPTAYYQAVILDSTKDWIDDGSGNQVFGVYTRVLNSADSGIGLTWVSSSNVVNWGGSFVGSPADYVDQYIRSPNGTWYKVSGYTNPGGGIGTFILYDTFSETAGSTNLLAVNWYIHYYSVDASAGHEYSFPGAQTITVFYPYRTNLYTMNEVINDQFADFIQSGYVTQAQFNTVKNDPVLLSSDYGTIDGFTAGVDVANLAGNLAIKGSGVTISIGSASDSVEIDTAVVQSLNAIQLSLNGIIITMTANELNQLAGIGATVTAANLDELTDGSYTDLHTHIMRFPHSSGIVGSVVYLNASNQTVIGIGDPAIDANGYKILGVIAGFDGGSGDALVVIKGPAPLYVGHSFVDGNILYLSTLTAGQMQTGISTTPTHHIIRVGEVRNGKVIVDVEHLWQVS